LTNWQVVANYATFIRDAMRPGHVKSLRTKAHPQPVAPARHIESFAGTLLHFPVEGDCHNVKLLPGDT